MLWGPTARIAFYVGIVSLIVGVIERGLRLDYILGISPMSFLRFAEVWFLIALVILASEILRNVQKS